MRIQKFLATFSVLSLIFLGIQGCSDDQQESSNSSLNVGFLDKVMSIDPAGSYDLGSKNIQDQVFVKLFDFPLGKISPENYAAESSTFSKDGLHFIVKVRDGLTFANGHKLTASDVKFSYDRVSKINDPNGPASLLDTVKSISVEEAKNTIDFELKEDAKYDVTIKDALAANAGPIVDEETFPKDKLLTDDEVVQTNAWSGPYTITSYTKNESAVFEPNPVFKEGLYKKAITSTINAVFYTTPSNALMALQNGEIDLLPNGLSAKDAKTLAENPNITQTSQPVGRFEFLTFNFNTQPFGNSQKDKDAKKAKAVREAIANLIDRNAIAKDVFLNSVSPAYSPVGNGLEGGEDTYKQMYGDNGQPSLSKATEVLKEAGVKTPVSIDINYNVDHYEASSAEEYNYIKSQLEDSGLFKVTLGTEEWITYQKDRVNTNDGDGKFQAYQMGWFADYPDADNYLRPFFGENNFINQSYVNQEVQKMLTLEPGTQDKTRRIALIKQIQKLVTEDIPIIPLIQHNVAIYHNSAVKGVSDIVNVTNSFKLFGLSK